MYTSERKDEATQPKLISGIGIIPKTKYDLPHPTFELVPKTQAFFSVENPAKRFPHMGVRNHEPANSPEGRVAKI
jgi:hypothetical protein